MRANPQCKKTALLCALVLTSGAIRPAQALVTAPVGGHAGEVDVNAGVTLERGTIEPNDNEDSWQDADWEIYTLGAGYTYGDLGPLQDFFFRLEAHYYDSPAEVSERADVAAADCSGDFLGDGQCQFHPEDQGTLIAPQLGFNLIHQPDFSLGLFLRVQIPIGVDFEKFVLPRTDFVTGGTRFGLRLKPWLTYESQLILGSGPLNGEQNATLAIANMFGFHADPGFKFGVRVGPYFDADLTERFDSNYDGAFFAGVPTERGGPVDAPEDTRDRIRMMRFGVTVAPYVNVHEHVALESSITEKLFGYDTPATLFMNFGVRAAF